MKTKKLKELRLRNCPDELHRALKERAKANHRTVNGQVLLWLEIQAGLTNHFEAVRPAGYFDSDYANASEERLELERAMSKTRQRPDR